MSTLKNRLFGIRQTSAFVFAASMLLGAASALAAPGAIWTSRIDGIQVNANVYDNKDQVYLNGGPQNPNGDGIVPDGDYYFMVTDPSGAALLSTDDIECRRVRITGGAFVTTLSTCAPPSDHPNGTPNSSNGSTPVKLMPYLDSPNGGGEYKVWLTPVGEYDFEKCRSKFGFCGDTKTDNFKVRNVVALAHVVACKFEDRLTAGTRGVQDGDEQPIPGWPMTITVNGTPLEGSTDSTGCFSATVPSFPTNGKASVTVVEGFQPNYIQTAPMNPGPVDRKGNSPAYQVVVENNAGYVTSTDVSPGDLLSVVFGNGVSSVTDTGRLLVSKDAFPSFKVLWGIDKTVAEPTTIYTNDTVYPKYTVTVRHDGGSEFRLSGTITVISLQALGPMQGTITDTVEGADCVISGGTPVDGQSNSVTVEVLPGVPVTLPYTCTFNSPTMPPDGVNTVTANWGPGAAQNDTFTDAFSFATHSLDNVITIVHEDIAVSDTLKGSLGDLSYPLPGGVKKFDYSDVPLTGVPGQCVERTNDASFSSYTVTNPPHAGIDGATVTICSAKDLTVSKTAVPSFKRTYTWGITKSVTPPTQNISGGSATFDYTVVVTQGESTDSAWALTGDITVGNPNAFAVTADVSDSVPGGTCIVNGGVSTVTINANSSRDVPYSCTFTAAPGTVTNTARVTWTHGTTSGSVTGTQSATFATPTDEDNKSINVSDTFDNVSGLLTPEPLTASDTAKVSETYTYKRTILGVSGQCVTKRNTAAFASTDTPYTGSAFQDATVCTAAPLTVLKTASVSFNRAYSWTITKDVVGDSRVNTTGDSATFNYIVRVAQGDSIDSGWAAGGRITVTNPNQWGGPISVTLVDAVGTTGCVVNGGQNVISVPQGGSSEPVPYTCTFSTSPGASITNTVTATWNASPVLNGSATSPPVIATFGDPTQTTNQTINVTDTFGITTTTLGTLIASDTATRTSAEYKYPQTVAAVAGKCVSEKNTARISAGDTVLGSDEETVTVCKGLPLTVTKLGTTSFTRTYKWTIVKTRTSEERMLLGGTASYSVTVSQDGLPVNENYSASGTIKVDNPNDWPVTVQVTDATNSADTCTVAGGTNVLVPRNGGVTLNYSCEVPSKGAFTNTATATWDPAQAITVASSASSAPNENTFTTPSSTLYQTIDVIDVFDGSVTTPLFQLTGSPTDPGLVWRTKTYENEVPPPETGCVVIDNVAKIVQTNQTSSAQVRNCNSGAHTIGFWQNKNGQGIIADDGLAGCGVRDFLRGSATDITNLGFNPFKDLNPDALCGVIVPTNAKLNGTVKTTVTEYVASVIKQASAKGASMHAMLKAQMLATALNVYFSQTAHNALGAPEPIGGLPVDLTNVRGQDVSAAFGGATSMRIADLLTYAAGRSNVGGTSWYDDKVTQEKAKNTFDAINNEDVVAP